MRKFRLAAWAAALLAGAAMAAPAAAQKAQNTVPAWDKTDHLARDPGKDNLPDEQALNDAAEDTPKDSPEYQKIQHEKQLLEQEQTRLRRQIDREFELLQKSPLQ